MNTERPQIDLMCKVQSLNVAVSAAVVLAEAKPGWGRFSCLDSWLEGFQALDKGRAGESGAGGSAGAK